MQKKLDILENKLYDDIILDWVLSEADSEMSIPVQVVYIKSVPREASGSEAGWTGKKKSQTESNFRQYPSLSPTLSSLWNIDWGWGQGAKGDQLSYFCIH